MAVEIGFEERLRREAMLWLSVRTHDGTEPISSTDLLDFEVDGRRFRLMDAQRGIRKPAEFVSALSIRTAYRLPGRERPYDDRVGGDGLLRYKWRGVDADHAENEALRSAMRREVPLIWFFGVGAGLYLPVFPYLLSEDRARQEFSIDPDVARGLVTPGSPVEDNLRRYIIRSTKQRLHQPVFRSTVLCAYKNRCAVCALHHAALLDAAHIVADSDESGIASIRNGLAMCKIHHAAFDRLILGVRPDLVVEIRHDLLEEIDGPMLRHGLQGRHQQPLMALPVSRREFPDPELLHATYRRFRSSA